MADSVLLIKSKDFAIKIVNLCKSLKITSKDYTLSNQLLRSGTSIGANIHESKYAHSTADFASKMQIALKECYETEYWLELLFRTEYIREEDYNVLNSECIQIKKMLIASINTVKNKESTN
jgi:four helix bundle protein